MTTKTTEVGNGWERTVTVFDAPVTINPEWWQFWRKPRVEMQTFTSSVYHKIDGDGYYTYGDQGLTAKHGEGEEQ